MRRAAHAKSTQAVPQPLGSGVGGSRVSSKKGPCVRPCGGAHWAVVSPPPPTPPSHAPRSDPLDEAPRGTVSADPRGMSHADAFIPHPLSRMTQWYPAPCDAWLCQTEFRVGPGCMSTYSSFIPSCMCWMAQSHSAAYRVWPKHATSVWQENRFSVAIGALSKATE